MCETKTIKRGRRAKPVDALMCQNCGAVMIANYDRMKSHRKNGFSYCDKECMYQDRGRVYRTSEAYQQKRKDYREAKQIETGVFPHSKLNWTNCNHCRKQFIKTCGRQSCSEACWLARDKSVKEAHKERQRSQYEKQSGCVVCVMCGKSRKVMQNCNKRRFCSDGCAKRSIRMNRRHRKRSNGLYEPISIEHLIRKYKGKCVECGCKVVRQSGEYQHNAATIDHIVPLSKGGHHTLSNVQLMCHLCNARKSNTVTSGTQLMLPMFD